MSFSSIPDPLALPVVAVVAAVVAFDPDDRDDEEEEEEESFDVLDIVCGCVCVCVCGVVWERSETFHAVWGERESGRAFP